MKHILPIIPILLLALAFASCHHGERQTLRSALQMAYADPDSALTMLHTIDRRALPPAEKAYYALTYYLAQNKSGLDVANDSLIRVAYNYYAKLPEDSLYARCMYYMGVYYSLSDSLERASYCLKEAAQAAKVQKDTATLCLVWCKNSWVARKSNAPLGLKYASQALALYRKYSQATPLNTIYYILLKGECETLCGKSQEALNGCKEAERLALSLGDSATLSNVYHDMGYFATGAHDAKAVYYARLARDYSSISNIEKTLSLAGAYCESGQYAACLSLLDTLHLTNNAQRYTAYYCRHFATLGKHDYAAAKTNADSAYHYIEKMFDEELQEKTAYFEKLMKENAEKARAEMKARALRFAIFFMCFLCLGAMAYVSTIYKNHKRKMAARLKEEEEKGKMMVENERKRTERLLAEEDAKMRSMSAMHAKTEKQHKEEQRLKDVKISTLMDIFLSKLDFMQKLEKEKDKKETRIKLTDHDKANMQMLLEAIDKDFLARLSKAFPQLSERDKELLILLRFNFSTNILARIMCVSETSVKQNLYLLKKKWAWEKRMTLFENSYRSFRTKHLQNKKNATEIEEDKHLFDSEVLLKSPPPLFPRFLGLYEPFSSRQFSSFRPFEEV